MTDPTSYAAGIEAAARVAAEFSLARPGSAAQTAMAIERRIRTLAPERGGGSWRAYQDAIVTTEADIEEAWRIIRQVSSDHLLNSTEGHVAVRKGIQYGRVTAAPPPPVPAPPAAPSGWRLVPVEPTEDMKAALAKAVGGSWDIGHYAWERALAAAPPAAPSGWRDQAQAILKRAWVCAHQLPGKDGEGEILLRLKSSADAYAVLDLLTAIWRDEPFPAPPPPVPAQAESGEVDRAKAILAGTDAGSLPNDCSLELAAHWRMADLAHAWDRVERGDARANSLAADLEAAEARIRELEGEVARLTKERQYWLEEFQRVAPFAAERDKWFSANKTAEARADRLTRAAETAREALAGLIELSEQDQISIDGEWGSCRNLKQLEEAGDLPAEMLAARDALATLSAALGGKE